MKRYLRCIFVCALLFLLLAAFVAFGDQITLSNGHTLRGVIVREIDDKLQVETLAGVVTIQKDRIVDIVKESGQKNELLRAAFLLHDRRWDSAFSRYLQVIDDNSTSASEVAATLLQYNTQILDAIPAMRNTQLNQLISLVQTISALTPYNRDFCFFGGRVLFESGECSRAFDMLTTIPAAYYKENEECREFMKRLLKVTIDDLLKREKFEEALKRIEDVTCLDESIGQSFQTLLFLHWGANKREQGEYREALNIYATKMLPLSHAIAINRIAFTIDEMVSRAGAADDYLEYVRLLEDYGKAYAPNRYDAQMPRLLMQYGSKLMDEKRFNEAKKVFQRYYSFHPSDVETRMISIAEYREKLERIPDNDFEAHYELGKFCVAHNLLDEAIKEFNIAAESDLFRKNATLQAQLLREKQEMTMFRQAMNLHAQSQFGEALDLIQQLRQRFPSGKLKSDIEKLARLCDDGLKDEVWRRPYQAEVYYQQAERMYYLNDFSGALNKIDSLLLLYPDTPAAEKAQELHARISRMANLARLEGSGLNFDKSKIIQGEAKDMDQPLESEIKSLLKDFNS